MRLPRSFRLTNALRVALAGSLACAGLALGARAVVSPHPIPSVPPAPSGQMNVLILGDSLALCGFGKRLDERFRSNPEVNATFTYMACGTNPLSWLKKKPYTNVKTQCGFWAIESSTSGQPEVLEDVYGMSAGHVPKAHLVPKLDDVMAAVHPDILVVQTGSNLFGIFPDAKTVHPSKHAAVLEKYLTPFKKEAIEAGSNLRKIYWVNPPTSGRVATEVQDFVFEQACENLLPEMKVIDSRGLVSYPYQHMEPDKEHFLGAQMDEWADKVYEIIEQDLAEQPIASLQPFFQRGAAEVVAAPTATPAATPFATPARALPVEPIQVARALPVDSPVPARALPVETIPPVADAPPSPTPERGPLIVKARLVFMSNPMPLRELLPYQESLVGYVYEVEKVLKGHYDEKQILVMHPAHIGTKPQRLKYRIGKRYKLRLDRMEGTLWDTAKARDESGEINLQPYIRQEDEKRHPESRRQ